MTHKRFFLFLFFFSMANSLSADWWLTELKTGLLYFQDSTMRHIYHDGVGYVEGELNYVFWDYIGVWGSVGYAGTRGRFRFENKDTCKKGDRTKIHIVPAALGVKFVYSHPCLPFTAYAGVGGQYYWIDLHNQSHVARRCIQENGWGGVAKVALLYNFCWNFFFEGFVHYNWKGSQFSTKKKHVIEEKQLRNFTVDVNSWTVGGALGYCF